MDILELLGKRIVFLDGAMGTLLQEKGLKAGELPEIWNIEKKEIIINAHKEYFKAGSDIVLTNTFGANDIKLKGKYKSDEVVEFAVKNAKKAAMEVENQNFGEKYVALDIGPTGKLLKPLGDLSFNDAYNSFSVMVKAGQNAGADLIVIETMSDIYETKAAVLAAKENSNLPVFVTIVFDENGKLLTGSDIKSAVSILEGLGVDALGMNCGLGPYQMVDLFREIKKYTSLPIIIKPNAGLPKDVDGETVFDIEAEEFSKAMECFPKEGAWILGGCCGTNPTYIKKLHEKCADILPKKIEKKHFTMASSYTHSVEFGTDPVIIGERINPTGKSKFKEALRKNDIAYILKEGFEQQQNGAHILDVNVGLPDIDEKEMLVYVMKELQSVIDLPLQIDTTDIEAMELALRQYNGKAIINSVNGKEENMKEVFPLAKKYGGLIVCLTLDESGIPKTAEGRLKIAEKIVKKAESYGIDKKELIIDVLAMTISTDSESAKETLKAIKLVKEKLGVKTSLGVSNISFGIPNRSNINAVFYTMALQNGMDAAIINPNSREMMRSYYSYRALCGIDENCFDYIEFSNDDVVETTVKTKKTNKSNEKNSNVGLFDSIVNGLKQMSVEFSLKMLESKKPLDIIKDELIPALDKVGKGFESGKVFLPQLLMSAEAAKASFEVLGKAMDELGENREKKGKIIMATVKGDIHDIGKNIVKVLLENYGFDVIDLGKDVAPEKIVEVAKKENIKLIGLSALMTTTVVSMKQTIELLKKEKVECKVMVGGAVLTQEYADMINADFYSPDAMGSVYYAEKLFEN